MVINSTLRPSGQLATEVVTGPALLTKGRAQRSIPRQVLISGARLGRQS
jgi:hypothetical protein